MSEQIINNITSKINNHFSHKYPLDFPKIGLNTDDLSKTCSSKNEHRSRKIS